MHTTQLCRGPYDFIPVLIQHSHALTPIQFVPPGDFCSDWSYHLPLEKVEVMSWISVEDVDTEIKKNSSLSDVERKQ